MPVNEQRRQKKLAKKKSERKAYERQRRQMQNGEFRLADASRFPIHESILFRSDTGLQTALLSRKLPGGVLAFASFMVDTECLGIKDCMSRQCDRFAYQCVTGGFGNQLKPDHVSPAYLAKFVLDAEAYARSLGFEPHPDYDAARLMLEGIDPSECETKFEFGRDGKPFFVSGPFDSPERCRHIMETLRRTQGQGNYHFLVRGDKLESLEELFSADDR